MTKDIPNMHDLGRAVEWVDANGEKPPTDRYTEATVRFMTGGLSGGDWTDGVFVPQGGGDD